MTLDDYLRRESAYWEHLQRWYGVWAVVYFGLLFGLVVILAPLQRAGVVPNATATAISLVYLFSSLPCWIVFHRIAARRLSARHGLVCPSCHQPCIAPLRRPSGQLIDITRCRRCGGTVVDGEGADSLIVGSWPREPAAAALPNPALPRPAAADPDRLAAAAGAVLTLDDYLRQESAFHKHLCRWRAVWAYLSLGYLVIFLILLRVLPKDVTWFLPLLSLFGYFACFARFERVATTRLPARYGLVCPHCRQPFTAPSRRRAGQLFAVPLCRRCGGTVVEAERGDRDKVGPRPREAAAADSRTLS
jgi:Zn-finger nucleic acid-binding protein